MESDKYLVEYGVIGLLLLMSVWSLAIGIERRRFYRNINVTGYSSRVRLESELSRRLTVISTIAVNAPYVGLLGTVISIMFTFHSLGTSGDMDVKSIMVGLSLALKATAAGIGVAIPCVALNNALRRRMREVLVDFDEAQGG